MCANVLFAFDRFERSVVEQMTGVPVTRIGGVRNFPVRTGFNAGVGKHIGVLADGDERYDTVARGDTYVALYDIGPDGKPVFRYVMAENNTDLFSLILDLVVFLHLKLEDYGIELALDEDAMEVQTAVAEFTEPANPQEPVLFHFTPEVEDALQLLNISW